MQGNIKLFANLALNLMFPFNNEHIELSKNEYCFRDQTNIK